MLLIRFATVAAACSLLLGAARAAQDPEKTPLERRTVTVDGEGLNREAAVHDALRKALEEGAGVQLAAYSETRNFELIRDTIYARAEGVVSEYTVLKQEKSDDGAVRVRVRATVRPDAVARRWGEVQNVLDQIGRPRIMVWINERIDGVLQKNSVVEARIEELFVEAGFDLVSREVISARFARHLTAEKQKRDDEKLVRAANQAGAHIFIRGEANADQAGLEKLYGIPAAFYNCDVTLEAYYTDTGRVIASESLPQVRAGVRSRSAFSPQAARTALVRATFPDEEVSGKVPIARRLYESVMGQWATAISSGKDIELAVARLPFKTYLKLKQSLEELDGVASVHGDYVEGDATFRLKTTRSAEALAEALTVSPFAELLEINSLKLRRIEARALGKDER